MIRPEATAELIEAVNAAPVICDNLSQLTTAGPPPEVTEQLDKLFPSRTLSPVAFADLVRDNPVLNPVLVEGLVRLAEVLNIIAPPKYGKSWLVAHLLLCIATGKYFLNTYQCHPGRVLLIDNELHAGTLAHRLQLVARAMGLEPDEYADRVDVLCLRGKGVTLPGLQTIIDRLQKGHYSAIIGDAWYRLIPAGSNENSNADVMQLYNLLDRYAEQTGAAWIVVHHASKGGQGEKAVTDVGAGAGAQSRAADAHLVLRPHEQDDHVVLEAAVRSFAPVEPIALRWSFPLWERAHNVDTTALKGRKSKREEQQDTLDADRKQKILDALAIEALTPRAMRDATGLSRELIERLLPMLLSDKAVTFTDVTIRGNQTREYTLVECA